MRLLRSGNYTRNSFSGSINEQNSYRVRRFVRLQYFLYVASLGTSATARIPGSAVCRQKQRYRVIRYLLRDIEAVFERTGMVLMCKHK